MYFTPHGQLLDKSFTGLVYFRHKGTRVPFRKYRISRSGKKVKAELKFCCKIAEPLLTLQPATVGFVLMNSVYFKQAVSIITIYVV